MTSPMDVVLGCWDGVKRSANGWTARFPAHAGSSPSLTIGYGDDGRRIVPAVGAEQKGRQSGGERTQT